MEVLLEEQKAALPMGHLRSTSTYNLSCHWAFVKTSYSQAAANPCESEAVEAPKLVPNVGDGADFDDRSWTQTSNYVRIRWIKSFHVVNMWGCKKNTQSKWGILRPLVVCKLSTNTRKSSITRKWHADLIDSYALLSVSSCGILPVLFSILDEDA